MTMLSGYRVLDLAGEEGAPCGKLFADLGAEVIAVEPPRGSASRRAPPYGKYGESLFWAAYGGGKRSVVLDFEDAGDRERFRTLAATADFLLEAYPPGYLDGLGLGYDALRGLQPGLIFVSITPYGQRGPYAGYRGSDLTLWSMGGHTYLCGDPDRPPVRVTAPQTWRHASTEALVGALIALYRREAGGGGQWVDVSAQQCVVWTLQMAPAAAQPEFGGVSLRRVGIYLSNPSGLRNRGAFACKDGFVTAMMVGGPAYGGALNAGVRALSRDGFGTEALRARDWREWDALNPQMDLAQKQAEIDALSGAFSAWFMTKTMEELYEIAIDEGLLLAPVYTARELYRSPQLAARRFWQPVDQGDRCVLRLPGPFIQASGTPLVPARAAPALDEARIDDFRRAGKADSRPGGPANPPSALAGLNVVDFSWVGVGPASAKYLADHGATVIKVETNTKLDPLRLVGPFPGQQPGLNRGHWFQNVNTNKLGITLDLNKPAAREVAVRLVGWADVLVESYTAGTMAIWDLDYEQLRQINPRLIMLSSTQQGQTGPHAAYGGYGNLLVGTSGLKNLAGWPDREPVGPLAAYNDFICHRFAAAAMLAALAARRRTGEGQHLDLSQLEASLQFLAPELLAFDATGEVIIRDGNRAANASPHGVFPCAGDDRWLALACWSDDDWQRLAALIGEPWADSPEYAAFADRKAREQALEEQLGAWTAPQDAYTLMARLQAAGLDAGVAQTCTDLYTDPQLAYRSHFQRLEHPDSGAALFDGFAAQLSETPGALRPAPCLGEHNAQVYREILGYSEDEIADFIASGVIN